MNIYFTVGPSQLYPTVTKHMQTAISEEIASKSHRGAWFQNLFAESTTRLKKLLSIPESHHVFFCSSGTEAMERSVQNLVEKKSFHVINGAFSKRFASTARELGKETAVAEYSTLEQQNISSAELICFTQNDTSTGICIDPEIISGAKKNNPRALIAVDIVSSAPYVNLDYDYIDCAFFSVQKLFGLPAGLGVMIISPQALEQSSLLLKKGASIGSYHSFQTLLKYAQKGETPETPPVLEIWLYNKVLKDMLKIGIEKIRKNIKERSVMLYNFFDNHPKWKPYVSDHVFRSQTTLAINFAEHAKISLHDLWQADEVKKKLQEQGLIVGSGYGEFKGRHLRFANFPAHKKENIEKLIEALKRLSN